MKKIIKIILLVAALLVSLSFTYFVFTQGF